MSRGANALDIRIGGSIRVHRIRRRMSQGYLAGLLNITQQQLQKYEQAANRVPASRLWQIAMALRVSIGVFLDEAETPKLRIGARDNLE